jgi:hypothetical protein
LLVYCKNKLTSNSNSQREKMLILNVVMYIPLGLWRDLITLQGGFEFAVSVAKYCDDSDVPSR